MKKINIVWILIVALFCSCSDFFEAKSDQVLKEQDDLINTPNEARTAMFGILHHLQEIGDNRVILGELRGDLLTVTDNSSQDLRDIQNFEVSESNAYLDDKKYYALINDCNYLISKIDTTIKVSNENVLYQEMGAAKTIRAWAYFQLCLNYGSVYYYNEAVLSTENPKYTKMELNDLVTVLIKDLLPFCSPDGEMENLPDYGSIENFASSKFFIPVRFMLGELYLWQKDYSNAANMYYQMIVTDRLYLGASYNNTWNDAFTIVSERWSSQFLGTNEEIVSLIPYSSMYVENATLLPPLFTVGNYLLAPSSAAIETWNAQTYSASATSTTPGDLRGLYGSYRLSKSTTPGDETESAYLNKYNYIQNYTILCRTAQIYLRFAEALNRLQKHTLAFAMLKNGLNLQTVQNPNLVSAREMTAEPFLNFGQRPSTVMTNLNYIFNRVNSGINSTGIHARGCGRTEFNVGYAIPDQFQTGQDTLQWLENQIFTEYALETAFEGNRFHDLMRYANYIDNPEVLAKKVAEKFPAGQRNAVISKLSNKNKWYLPSTIKIDKK